MCSGAPFALAGILESWRHPAREEIVRSFAIITTPANAMIEAIQPGHRRSDYLAAMLALDPQ